MIKTRLRSGAAAAKRISTLTSDVPAVKTKKKSNQSQANGGEDKPRVKEDILEQATSSKKVSQRKARSVPVKIEYSDGALKEEHSTGASPYFTWKPDNWEQVLSNIRQMRQEREAPVDTMGCDKCPDQTLPEKNKAKHLKRTSQVLLDEYDGDIPDSIEGLCKLPGVGPKMSYLAMSCGWKRTVGIGVDTHVHRISNWLGWLPQTTKTPEQTRKALEAWLPRDLWDEVNHLLVGFGQTVCKPVAPKCSSCLNLQLCPYGRKQVNSKKEAT